MNSQFMNYIQLLATTVNICVAYLIYRSLIAYDKQAKASEDIARITNESFRKAQYRRLELVFDRNTNRVISFTQYFLRNDGNVTLTKIRIRVLIGDVELLLPYGKLDPSQSMEIALYNDLNNLAEKAKALPHFAGLFYTEGPQTDDCGHPILIRSYDQNISLVYCWTILGEEIEESVDRRVRLSMYPDSLIIKPLPEQSQHASYRIIQTATMLVLWSQLDSFCDSS